MANGSRFGREARGRRLELGMSQSVVAGVVGVPVVQIGRWERGKDIPDSARVQALADALHLDPHTARTWLRLATPAETVSVEILGGALLPTATAAGGIGVAAAPGDRGTDGERQRRESVQRAPGSASQRRSLVVGSGIGHEQLP